MKLTLAEPKYLKESIAIISELVTEGRFKINKDSIELIAMDPANVAMVIFKLLSSSFSEYEVDKDIEISINLSNLKSILRRTKPTDIITLEMEGNRLKIQIKGISTRSFLLPLIDIEEKQQKIPELNFPVDIKTSSEILNDAIEDVDVVSDSVSFEINKNRFIISAEWDLSQAKIEMKEGQETKIKAKDNVKARYSIEYLKKMIGGSKLADNVEIYFNKDYPLRVDYKTLDKIQLSFILAPRVENE